MISEPLYIDIDEEAMEFPIDNLRFKVVLGEGQFGVVYLATANGISGNIGKSQVAVKMLKGTFFLIRKLNIFGHQYG